KFIFRRFGFIVCHCNSLVPVNGCSNGHCIAAPLRIRSDEHAVPGHTSIDRANTQEQTKQAAVGLMTTTRQ
ncbi:MAG: hypothetical protein O2780_21290, partial [Proteobacteria bacterium]|nr:hypothetical protein [Pseudomonadota bacterium]